MTKTVSRRRSQAGIIGRFTQFLMIQAEKADLTKSETDLKKELKAYAETEGYVDEEKGHRVVDLPEPITTPKGRFRGFMSQRRVTSTLDEEKAERFLRRKGLYEECLSTYLDADKVSRLYAEDKITEKEYDSLIKTTETFAFVPVKD